MAGHNWKLVQIQYPDGEKFWCTRCEKCGSFRTNNETFRGWAYLTYEGKTRIGPPYCREPRHSQWDKPLPFIVLK